MKGARTLRLVLALALVSAFGIVGLLLAVNARFDGLLLPMAALPLVVGLWCWRKESRGGRRSAS